MSDQDKSFVSTIMHLVKVWDVSLYEKKSSGLFIKSTKEALVELLIGYLELSIVEHGSTIFLKVKVTSRRITRVHRTSSPSWS